MNEGRVMMTADGIGSDRGEGRRQQKGSLAASLALLDDGGGRGTSVYAPGERKQFALPH